MAAAALIQPLTWELPYATGAPLKRQKLERERERERKKERKKKKIRERKGKERKGKERKGKERKGKERKKKRDETEDGTLQRILTPSKVGEALLWFTLPQKPPTGLHSRLTVICSPPRSQSDCF